MIIDPTLRRSAAGAWLHYVHDFLSQGMAGKLGLVAPRDEKTIEGLGGVIDWDLAQPVCVGRSGLNYKFMAAEALMILNGSDKVADVADVLPRMSDFSDDGETFFGAYGPKVVGQLDYVVSKLIEDPFSRQAGLTIWRENPPKSKDIPCTVGLWFHIRGGAIHVTAFMRSSDLWLGLPYDMFNFSMIAAVVCARLNRAVAAQASIDGGTMPTFLQLGSGKIMMASTHMYMRDHKAIVDNLMGLNLLSIFAQERGPEGQFVRQNDQRPIPYELIIDEEKLMAALAAVRQGSKEARWWNPQKDEEQSTFTGEPVTLDAE